MPMPFLSSGTLDNKITFNQFLNNWHAGLYADVSTLLVDNNGTHVLVIKYIYDKRGNLILIKSGPQRGQYLTKTDSLLITDVVSSVNINTNSVFDPTVFDLSIFG